MRNIQDLLLVRPQSLVGSLLFFVIVVFAGRLMVAQEAGGDGTESGSSEVKALRIETLADDIDAGSGGVAIDKEGNVYTADFGSRLGRGGTGGHRLYKITPQGDVTLFAKGFRGASGNCFDAEGNIYQSNIGGNSVSKVSPEGKVTQFSSGGFSNPVGILMDPKGDMFICNCGNGTIRKITSDGESTLFCKSPLLKCPNGITIDPERNLYVANFYNGNVIKITPDAKASVLATLPGNNNGHLTYHKGSLYVIARSAHQVYRVSLDGKVKLFAGSGKRGKADGDPKKATFSYPNDIGVSPDGKYMYLNETSPVEGSAQVLAPTRVRRIVLNSEPEVRQESPDIVSKATLASGAKAFRTGMCFKCHGDDGSGAKFGPNIANSKWEHCDGTAKGILGVLKSGISKSDVQNERFPHAMNPATNLIKNEEALLSLAHFVKSLNK